MTAPGFYNSPSYMSGGYTVYGGTRRQRGGSIFGSIRKMFAPVGRRAIDEVKNVATLAARKTAAKGAQVLSGVALDAIRGRNIGDSFKKRGTAAAMQSLEETLAPLAQGNYPPRKKQKQQPPAKKLKQRKKSTAPIKRAPLKKRNRKLSRAALNRNRLF